jgi:hypothetical protein
LAFIAGLLDVSFQPRSDLHNIANWGHFLPNAPSGLAKSIESPYSEAGCFVRGAHRANGAGDLFG